MTRILARTNSDTVCPSLAAAAAMTASSASVARNLTRAVRPLPGGRAGRPLESLFCIGDGGTEGLHGMAAAAGDNAARPLNGHLGVNGPHARKGSVPTGEYVRDRPAPLNLSLCRVHESRVA